MRYVVLAVALLLSGCGARPDLTKGPVVLRCDGEEINAAGNGEVVREKRRSFFRLDGKAHTLERWDDEIEMFYHLPSHLVLTQTEARYSEPIEMAGIFATRTITFDRVAGRVTEELAITNAGTITFKAACRPVKDPAREVASERKKF